jgi:D-alanine--poly(phosphoribitol) ligase subunit 1
MFFDLQKNAFAQTGRRPEKLAFAAADADLSWQELKTLSDGIVASVRQAKIPAGHPVLVHGDKEAFFLAALVACLREQLPFICVSSELPRARIEFIRSKSGSQVIIDASESNLEAPVKMNAACEVRFASAPDFTRRFTDTRYVIFTSGSSGEPKGVCISAQNVSDFMDWFVKDFPVDEETVFINQASFLFDIALADFFGALQTGGAAVFNSNTQARSEEFIARIQRYKGNYWNSTPSFVSYCLLHEDFHEQHLPNIRSFVLSGEQLSPSLVKKLRERFPGAQVINAYGPTETTIFASRMLISEDMLRGPVLPIAAFDDGRLHIVKDEILVCRQAGAYLEGEDGFFEAERQRCFRTGDRVRIGNGLVYFSGRGDSQVKLNGYRIDLNEVKFVVEKVRGVRQAVCVPVETGGRVRSLVAFVEAEGVNAESIRTQLRVLLPAYMIPADIVVMREFPHTNSYKGDVRLLLEKYLSAGR